MATSSSSESEKQVIVFGIDDSEHSTYALKWTLDHFFTNSNPVFKLALLHAKPSPTSAVGLAGPGAAEILPFVDSDLKNIAARVVENAKKLCIEKSVNDVIVEVVEGDPRNVLCEAVEKHHASILVVGSHGYGAIKRPKTAPFVFVPAEASPAIVLLCGLYVIVFTYRAVLGSVSDYCAHHAHCTVMIVKKPKSKH